MKNPSRASHEKKLEALIIVALCLFALLPFTLNSSSARNFFWFGDEFHLLIELREQGMTKWAFNTFAENFVPLFKLLWGSLVCLSNGSYFGVLTVVWCTHALMVGVFYLTMRIAGIGMLPSFAAGATLALSWSNIETLMWSVQWSALLSILFSLLAVNMYLKFSPMSPARRSIKQLFFVFILGVCGTLCFSKGVINALAFCMATLIMAGVSKSERKWNLLFAIAALLPALIVAFVIFLNSTGNHHKLSGGQVEVFRQMGAYGLYYFSCNPLARLVRYSLPSEGALGPLIAFFLCKCLVIGYGLLSTFRSEHKKGFFLLVVLLLVDLLTAFFLGVGRFHEGISNAISSRYQYSSLISFTPFLFIALNRAVDLALQCGRLPVWPLGNLVKMTALVLFLLQIYKPWSKQMEEWSYWRGEQGRKLLFDGELDPKRPPQYGPWIGLPPMVSLEQAHMLVKEYNLH